MTISNLTPEQKTWVYTFGILVMVSAWMLSLQLKGSEFLALDFQMAVVYFPTVIAGIITAFVIVRRRQTPQ